MTKEGTSFEEASFVVGEVVKAKAANAASKAKSVPREPVEVRESEEDQLRGRRMPPRRGRVLVRQFYFME